MKYVKSILGYAGTIRGVEINTKRAWAELFEMERKLIRQKYLLRLYAVLLIGFLFGLLLNKIGF
jgi:hypothetical protein